MSNITKYLDIKKNIIDNSCSLR